MTAQFWVDPFYATHNVVETKSLKFKTLYGATVDEYFLVCAGLLAIVFAVVLILFYLPEAYKPQIANGIDSLAQVIGCQDKKEGRNYHVNLAFQFSADTKVIQTEKEIAGDFITAHTCDEFPIGSSLKILYQTDSPENVDINDDRAKMPAAEVSLLQKLMIGAVLFGLCVMFDFVRRLVRYRALRRNGILLNGHISHYLYNKSNSKSSYFLSIEYQFSTPENKLRKATLRMNKNTQPAQLIPEPATNVYILYLNRNLFCLL